MISYLVQIAFNCIYLIIFVVVILSWIPIFDQNKEPIATLLKAYYKIMKPFRSIVPPIGGVIDVSPLIAYIILKVMEILIVNLLSKFGL